MRLALASLVCALVCSTAAPAAPPLPDACSLVTKAQVAEAIGGSPQARSAAGSNRLEHTCTWTGPPQGYMQSRTQFTISILRVSKATFLKSAERGDESRVSGLGAAASTSQAGLSVWKNGILVELEGPSLSVYPAQARALARSVLRRL